VADERPFHEVFLDYAVYAPVGLVLAAAEELPRLAELGRSRVASQLRVAHVVGKFAVRQVQRRLSSPGAGMPGPSFMGDERFRDTPGGSAPPTPGDEPVVDRGAPVSEAPAGAVPPSRGAAEPSSPAPRHGRGEAAPSGAAQGAPAERRSARVKSATGARSPSKGSTKRTGGGPRPAETGAAAGTAEAGAAGGAEQGAEPPQAGRLAIPGYDSLAASQVVQRLSSLEPDELEAIRLYESATRRRRTILHRIAQLSAPGGRASA